MPPNSVAKLWNLQKKKRVLRGNESLSAAIKVVKETINSQREIGDDGHNICIDEDNEDGGTQDNWTDHDENALIEKDGETCVYGKRKTKKAYKTNTLRGLTRNLNMAKMRPGEKLKVDFTMNGQPIGNHRATLANYCGALVKDPLNAPLYEVEQFSQIPQENKDKMWQLVLDKFDIGLNDDQEEEERKKKYMLRRKFIMESLNKKYRNFRARLKSDYYDTEEMDEDRLKEENMPNFVDKKDWEWLVKYFGSEEFQPCTATMQPCVAALYCCPAALHCCQLKSGHVASLSLCCYHTAARLLEQRKAGEISLMDEEIYAKIKLKGKHNNRDRRMGAMNEAAEAKKEAISANEQNQILTKKLKDVKRENKDFEESNEEYDNEEDKDEEEISKNNQRHE
ncbi:hypothetical protein RDABS01_003739 [Bienertia sinuspersici]